jgi:hypothetical protein
MMKTGILQLMTAALGCFAMLSVGGTTAEGAETQVAHMVYFKLKDDSKSAKDKLVAACKKYLDGHEGVAYFSVGLMANDLDRDVNDREWDVSLNLIFKTKAAHDVYQDAPRHLQFINENKATWAKVRVFDSYLVP